VKLYFKVMQTIEKKLISRIYGHGRGWVFTQIDFIDLAPRGTIDWLFKKLESNGTIKRVLRGIYYYPEISTLLNEQLPVEIPRVAQTLARKFGWFIIPSGETALNTLGISSQVPSTYVYITNGRNVSYQIEKRELIFRKGMYKETTFVNMESSILVQALKAYGKENLDDEALKKFKQAIPPTTREKILKDTRSVTGWIYQFIQKICG
jgi:hypothetical protein